MGVRTEELVFNLPLIHILANAKAVGFVFHGCFLLRPAEHAFKVYFVSAGDDDIGDFLIANSAADGLGIYAKKTSRFGDGKTDHLFWVCVLDCRQVGHIYVCIG
mgnify:CR=1 FL=1